MQPEEILRRRLAGQALASPRPADVTCLVAQLGAVQAQDYPAAKWALGLRVCGSTDASVEAAFAEGHILRTHVLRPTWHFVAPADIRWLLVLMAPRVHAVNAAMYRRLALDEALFRRSNAVLANALQGGQQRTRAELGAVLQHASIATDDAL